MFYGNGGSENRNQRPVWSQVLEVERQCEFVGLFLFFFSLVESFLRSGSLGLNESSRCQKGGEFWVGLLLTLEQALISRGGEWFFFFFFYLNIFFSFILFFLFNLIFYLLKSLFQFFMFFKWLTLVISLARSWLCY